MLYALSTLEYAKIVADSTDNESRYGLDTPQVQITLWQQDGSSLGPLVVGKTTDTEVAGTETVSERNDMVAGSERLKMFPRPRNWESMIDENSNFPPLNQLAQQKRYPGIAKKNEDNVPKKFPNHKC